MPRLAHLTLIALVGATLLAACAGDEPDTDVVDVDAATVGVLATGCGPTASAGSGVVLGAPGQVVTVAHTVAGATDIAVVDAAGTERAAQLVAFDADSDLAVLMVDDFDATPLATGAPRLGSATAHVWSREDGVGSRPVEVTTRLAITIDDIYGERSVKRSGMELAGDIEVGDSGGPVVTPDGTVIGIVYARSRTRGSTAFATDVTEIERVLATLSETAGETAGETLDAELCV